MNRYLIIRITIFFLGLLVTWHGVNYILERPKDEQWDHSGMSYVYNDRDYYDVIFAGTSVTITNISIEELFLKYGIAGVTIGEPSQPTYLSYYSLEEALKYQQPKVVLFDVNALFYSEEDLKTNVELNEHHHLHYSFDSMKNNSTKYNAFFQAKEITPELDFWNYFSNIYYNHSNWQSLSKGNFSRKSSSMIMNGNLLLLTFFQVPGGGTGLELFGENTGEIMEIPEINLKYLNKMINLCNDRNIPLVLTRGGGTYSWGKYNAIKEISLKYGIPYIDLKDFEDTERIDLYFDSSDGTHFNVIGAKKWTNILGEYLINNYEFTDRRNDSNYNRYLEQEDFYNSVLKATNDTISLRQTKDLDSYLSALRSLDLSDTTVFVAVKDEASTHLTYNEIWQMNELGLSAELKNKYRYSYIGITGENGIHELLGEEQLYYIGKIGQDINYAVTSGGFDAGNLASVMINGVEMAQNGRGINIVVYNSTVDKVISSVYFDTFQYENPPVSRIVSVEQAQYEADMNSWLPLADYQIGEAQ